MNNVGMIATPEIPTQLQPGRHCAVFRGGPRLFVELDGSLCSQATPQNAVYAVVDARARLDENFPALALALSRPATTLIVGTVAGVALTEAIKLPGVKAAGVIVAAYIAVHLVVRWTALQIKHRNSADGGVLIEYPPPYYPVLFVPQIFPRGGYQGERIEQGVGRQKIGEFARGAIDAGKSKLGTINPPPTTNPLPLPTVNAPRRLR
jgi:hypothetical protein